MSLAHKNPSHVSIKTMVFIDAGYLNKWIKEKCKMDLRDFDYASFCWEILKGAFGDPYSARIIRAYYYDGIVEPGDPEFEEQKKFHEYINSQFANFEVREGTLVKDGKGNLRQKGVDTLLAIDMIEKANSNQYEIAFVVAGDLDHLEAIKTVKNKGIQICGVYGKKYVAKDLELCFDKRVFFDKLDLCKLKMKNE